MSNQPIYVDASRSARLDHGANSVDCLTLQEAVIAFNNLPEERQEIATIICAGRTYDAQEIRRLHHGARAV